MLCHFGGVFCRESNVQCWQNKMKKLRIVWLCTFSNAEKQSHLRFWRRVGGEVGQWIPNLLEAFANDESLDIHVISLDAWLRDRYVTWKSGGITYHCFQPNFPGLGYNFRIPYDQWTHYRSNRRRICRLIDELGADVVHLFGCENARYATAVLDLPSSIPVVCTIQGFATRELPHRNTYINRVRSRFEQEIMRRLKYFTGDYDSEKVVRSLNPSAAYAHTYFPVNERLMSKILLQKIKYDVLFAGSQTKSKGFGDFLEVCAYCAERKSEFKAAVVGTVDAYPGTRDFIVKHHFENVITFTGRFPTQAGLFEVYRQSKMFLAPTYNDAFASTIRENMLLGTPCIAYRTGGIPYANDDGNENVVIVEQGDWRAMAEKVMFYSRNEAERLELAARAKAYAENTFSLDANVAVIKRMYEKVLNHGM